MLGNEFRIVCMIFGNKYRKRHSISQTEGIMFSEQKRKERRVTR